MLIRKIKTEFIGKGKHFNYDETFNVQTGYLRESKRVNLRSDDTMLLHKISD